MGVHGGRNSSRDRVPHVTPNGGYLEHPGRAGVPAFAGFFRFACAVPASAGVASPMPAPRASSPRPGEFPLLPALVLHHGVGEPSLLFEPFPPREVVEVSEESSKRCKKGKRTDLSGPSLCELQSFGNARNVSVERTPGMF